MIKINLFSILIAAFLSIVLWSIFFEIDKSINVNGVVEPKGNVISLQNRFDSKIIEVNIKESMQEFAIEFGAASENQSL